MTSFDDDEAAATAAQARQQGLNIVRSHLQSHLSNNPDSSYVSWIATLHPENAKISIDDRFFIPGNPWQMVYEETLLEESDTCSHNEDSLDDRSSESWRLTVELWRRCSPIDVLIGCSLTLVTATTVASLEIAALVIYFFEYAFSHLTNSLEPPSLATLWIYGIAQFLYHLFASLDSILLLLSVAIGELLAAIQYGLSLLFGGFNFASIWHQAIRRVAHQIRVRFRAPFDSPKRNVFGNVKALIEWCKRGSPRNEDDDESQAFSAMLYSDKGEYDELVATGAEK